MSADGVVVEVGFDARDIDLMARHWERLVAEHGDEDAWGYLSAVVKVVPQYVPAYIVERVQAWRAQGIPGGWRRG